MNTIYSRPYYLILLLFIVDAGGQDRRGDVIPEVEVDNIGAAPNVNGGECSCKGSVVAAVIITIVIFLILALLWWCFAKKRRRDIGNKPDPEAASRAAYDNPHFQGDDLDSQQNEGQTRINMVPPRTTTQQTTTINPVGTPQAKVTTTATNTTSTLERGKSTLERVMAAVLSSSRSSSSKKSKDDSFTEPKQVIVPLQGHDFTGLGFTVHGNLKEGLYVKEVMSRGPASQSGQIIPGDRVMALTVFTDHIVIQDALTILSYASPYPVLLHLEKSHTLGSFLGGSSATCKRKFAPSNAPATKLVHPGFRSQSHGDLAKLGSIDIKKMNMDNLVSASSKSKGIGLTIDLPKVQTNKLVQRSGETRHSERAIDVPGVDIRNKSSSIEVNIDDGNEDKVELANVQVHRPMSPAFGVDIPDASVEMPTFHDAELSRATEKLPHLRTDINLKEPSADKIDPKVKFGIKVFPDMGFMKRASKGFEVDLERGKDSKRTNQIDHQKLSHETEIAINTNRKRSLDLGMDKNTSNFKFGEGIDIKTSNLESSNLNTDSKTSKEAKFGFGIGFDGPDLSQNSPNEGKDYEIEISNANMPSFNMKGGLNTQFFRDTHNMSEDENEKEKSKNKFGMEIGAPDISLPSINLNTNKKERNHSLELVGDDNKRVKSNQGGLEMKIGVPDINLPSLDFKSKAKSDESTSEELDKEKEKNHKSKKHGFKIGSSDFHLPSFNLKTGNIFEGGSLEPDKKVDANSEINTHALTIEAPDINLPSFKLKAGSKTAGQVSDNEDDKYNESKLEFKRGTPEFHLPSLNIKGKDKFEENMSQDSDNEDQTHKSKHSFNIGVPDIHAPSFSLKPGAKTDGDQEISDNEQDKHSKSKKHGFKIGATDFHLPSLHLKAGVKADERVTQELDNEDDKTHKSKQSFSIEGPDMHLPSLSMKSETKIVGNVHEVSENEDDKNSKSKKHGFKIGAPDIHLPSFNLKGEAKTDEKLYPDSDNEEDKKHKSKHSFNIEAPDLHLPSFSLKSNAKAERDIQDVSDNEEDKNSKSKRHGFKMGIPDLHLPSFNLKSGAKVEEKVSQFSDNDEDKKDKSKHSFSIGTPDINLPFFHLKKGAEAERYIQEEPDDKEEKHSKSKKHGFQIDAPDIKLPSFNLKSGSKNAGQVSRESDEENSEDSKHKHGFIKGAPDITIPSFKLKAGAKSHGNMSPESDKDEDKDDKSKHIIKIGAPDIHLPSFKLKTEGDISPEVDNEKHKHSKSEKHGFKIEAPDMHLPTFKLKAKIEDDEDLSHKSDKDHNNDKSKHSFKIGTPDLHLPTFKMKSGGKTDDDILQFSDKETSQKYEFEHDFKIDAPDINLPSISLESNAKPEASVQERSDNDADSNSKSKKHGFKIGVPDFHLPSFHLKTGAKTHGKVSHEVEDIQDDKNDKSKRSFSIGAPDISLPSIKLKGEGKIEGVVQGEPGNKEDNDTKSKNRGFKIEGPNFHLPSFNKKAGAKTDEHVSKEFSEEGKEDGKSKHGFKIGAPDIHIPSFKLKAGAKSHGDKSQDSDKEDDKNGDSKHGIEIGIPDIQLPTFKLKSDDGPQGIEKEKDKISKSKKLGFHIGAPDIHLPTFKLKSEAKFDNEMLQESDNLDNKKDDKSKYGFKVGASDINIPSFKMKAGAKSEDISPENDIDVSKNSKSKHGFKIGAPDIHLPSFNLTTGVKADADNLQGFDSDDNKDKSKHSFKIGVPDINLPSFKLKAGTKGEDGSPESDNDEDIKSKSPKHGFRIGAPDIHLPSFNIKKTGRSDLDLHHELKEGKDLKSKQEFHVDTPTIDLPLPSVDFELDDRNKYKTKDELNEKDLKSKSKHSFHLGMPDINLPTFNLKGSDTSDRESNYENEDSHKSKHGFKIGMSDIDLPSFSLKSESSNSAKLEDENKSKSNYDLEIDTPDLNAPSLRLEGKVTPDNDAVKEKSKSNYGFKIGMPDINLPSLNFRNRSNSKESSEEIDDFKINSGGEIKLVGPDINAPSINLESKLINKEASYDIKSSKLEDLNLNLEAKMPSVEVEKPEAELRGTKFKLPGFGFKTGEKEDKTLSKEINTDMNKKSSIDLDLHDPKIKLPNVSLEADMKAKDKEKVSRKKSKEKDSSGFGFSLKGPDINLPSFDIRSGKEKDDKGEIKKESDDEKKSKKEKKKSKEKSGFNFKFKGPDFSFPNFGGKSDKSIKESKDSKSDDKSGKLEYNIQPLEVKLDGPDIKIIDKIGKHTIKMHEPEVELNAKMPGVSGADIDLQSNINLEKEKTEEKSSKGGKFGLNFKAPDIQMPNIHFAGKYKDESIEENHNSGTNKEPKLSVDIPNVEIDLKKHEGGFLTARNLNAELEAPDIALPNLKVATQKGSVTSNAINIEGEDVNNENFKWGLNFKGPSIGLSKNKDKSVNKEKGDRDIVAEDINFKIPNLKFNNNLKNEQKDEEKIHKSGKDEGKIHKSGINFDFNLPDFNLSKYETKPDVEDKFSDSDSKTDYDLRIKMPEIPSGKFNLKGENKFDDDNFNIDLDKQSSKINMSIPEYKLKTNQTGRIDTEQEVAIKIPHYEVGSENVEYKIAGPEMPNLNFDGSVKGEMNDVVNKNDMKSKGFGFKIKAPDFNLPDFKLKNSKNEAQFNTNEKRAHKDNEDNSENEDEDNNKKKKDFGFSVKMPDINLPDFMLVGNKGKSEEIKYDCSLPDELKVEAGNQVRGEIDLEKEIPNLKSTDVGMPNFSSPNISLNEKEIKFGSEKSKYPDFDLAVNLPELNMPKLGLKDNESQPTNGKIAMTVDDPSYSTDIATEDLSDYLNITDATKKKRFGFKIKTPDMALPDFLRSSKDNESKEKELFDKNQSDEMKSYNLKLKTPTIGIGSVPRNEEIEILSDEEIVGLNVKLPRVKVPNITSISSDSSEKDGSHRRNSSNSGVFGGKIKSSEIIIPKFSLKEKESSETLKYESDEWKMKEIEVDITSPSVSLLRGKFDNLSSENISNAGEISVKTALNANLNEQNIKLPNFDLQRKIFEEPDNADAEKNYKLKYDINGKNFKINSRDVDYNADESNFIIPEMKMQPGLSEDFKIPNLKFKGDMKFDANHTKPEIPIHEKGKSIEAGNETKPYHGNVLTESDIHFNKSSKFLNIDGETGELKYEVNKPIDFNVSTDLSSLEAECDLPEADLDLKKASFDFPVDATIPKLSMTKITLEKNMNLDTRTAKMQTQHMNKDVSHEISNKFGKAFGFQGFKKHIDFDNVDIDLKTEQKEGKNMKLNISDVEIPNNANVNINLSPEIVANNFELTKDLPEADYDTEFKEKMYESEISIAMKRKDKSLPEGDQALRGNIINTSTYNYDFKDDKQYNLSSCSDNEGEKLKLLSEVDFDAKLNNKRDEEDDQSKTKTKLGLGFGFKGFGKSDSEDNDPDNKIYKGPEGEQQDVKEKNRTKSKKTFSFKGFGRNSSDTEEEHTEAISENPMKKVGTDEKHKSNTKNSLNFGFKTKGSKNSDSDDNVENEKVEMNPQVGHKKHKMKGNLGFGFMHKTKTPDTDHHPVHTEFSTEIIKDQHLLEEEKNKVSLSHPQKIQSKDTKYDTRSESEGGDEERMSMDSKGEDGRSKSRYGIGFGFRKSHAKNSSDSEGGETYEQKVHLDERGSSEKTKESKSKSLKLGFKGFKNLKGKIQTEINKMRHDSPSSDEENLRGEESTIHGEKRKKVSKKKDKENKVHRESDSYLDTSEEAALASAANAAKDNRRRKFDSKSSSPSSSDSSSDDDTKSIEPKKKKKAKSKRKDEGRVVSTGVIEVNLPSNNNSMEISENISPAYRSVDADMPNIETYETSHVTVVRSEPSDFQEHISNHNIIKQNLEMQSNPPRYVVVREMKLKQPLPHTDSDEVHEIMDKISIDKKIPYPLFLEERAILNTDAYIDGVSWGSDSDMEKLQGANGKNNLSKTSVNLKVSGKQRPLTDSEELKRKAASLGDLSRLHESGNSLGTLLERASSLDLKNASDGHPSLHVRRLQLPDSSATSIDEADEPPLSAKKLEASGFLKAAGQWGTLEEALQLGIHSNKHMKIDATTSAPSVVSTTIVKNTSDEGAPVSNIEISGGRGSSITALSVKKNSWNESFEEDSPPSLPISPIPLGKTTITVKELDTPIRNLQENSGSDSSIVVVGNETIQSVNNNRNINIKLNPTSSDTLAVSSQARMGSSTSINSESDRYSPRLRIHNDGDEVGVVTVTMVPAESHPNARIASVNHIPPPVPPKPKASRPLSSPPELISYENMTQSSLVTVSHDWMQENGEIVLETSEHNISDEYMTPDSSPQKSMTQITLEGDGLSGYTVTEGTISRTVIISNPDLSSPISIIQTDKEL